MKKQILLLLVMITFITVSFSQKRQKKSDDVTGYAITSVEKGGRSWREVRLVNFNNGEEISTVYQSKQETEAFNARTGSPVVKKDVVAAKAPVKKVVNLDQELAVANGSNVRVQRVVVYASRSSYDQPFSTNSAAMAYDKKHERLYYTPMGINQLRYIDLKTNKIFYFEDEPFGFVKGMGDGANQITRMVIASDGNGYALTNDANHLIRFTTGKNPVITDLGAITESTENLKVSIHSNRGYGGDMVADANGNLYLVTANRNVFKIAIDSKMSSYLGPITGLPNGFSTNAAMVEGGSKVIVASAQSSAAYYRFDLNTLESEKIAASGPVYNASDLANDKLAFSKNKKDKKNNNPEIIKPQQEELTRRSPVNESAVNNGIAIYPNPVTNGLVKISFANQPAGRYSLELIDVTGKLIKTQEINIGNGMQVEEMRIPASVGRGSYLLKVTGINNKVSFTNKLVVQ